MIDTSPSSSTPPSPHEKTTTEGLDVPLGDGGFVVSSNFDSGNLRVVKLIDEEKNSKGEIIFAEFEGSTAPDCYGTKYENTNRTWFYFSITTTSEISRKATIKITLKNLNRQGKLFSQGHEPVVRIQRDDGVYVQQWIRSCENISFEEIDKVFFLTWEFNLNEIKKLTGDSFGKAYFAFCYPFSYDECQTMLSEYDKEFGKQSWSSIIDTLKENHPTIANRRAPAARAMSRERINTSAPATDSSEQQSNPEKVVDKEAATQGIRNTIYYHRELLVDTLEGLRVDLVTISSCEHILPVREPRLPSLFPNPSDKRSHKFSDQKRVFFLSSRVHPGETPASFVFNGFIKFILQQDHPVAKELRRLYVFKMIPILNPDGVRCGHYRTDKRGVNLNRVYHSPNPTYHSPIYASRAIVDFYQQQGTLKFYVDLHAHASKRGCFIFGNALEMPRQIENVLFAKLVDHHSRYFEFEACNFSERNMFSRDKKDGMSKEGSGRVGTFLATNLCHCYTLECNYNTGRYATTSNVDSDDDNEESSDEDCSEDDVDNDTPTPYTIEAFEDVGKGVALAAFDITSTGSDMAIDESVLQSYRESVTAKIRAGRVKKGGNPDQMPTKVAVALRRYRSIQSRQLLHARSVAEKEQNKQIELSKKFGGSKAFPSQGRSNRPRPGPKSFSRSDVPHKASEPIRKKVTPVPPSDDAKVVHKVRRCQPNGGSTHLNTVRKHTARKHNVSSRVFNNVKTTHTTTTSPPHEQASNISPTRSVLKVASVGFGTSPGPERVIMHGHPRSSPRQGRKLTRIPGPIPR